MYERTVCVLSSEPRLCFIFLLTLNELTKTQKHAGVFVHMCLHMCICRVSHLAENSVSRDTAESKGAMTNPSFNPLIHSSDTHTHTHNTAADLDSLQEQTASTSLLIPRPSSPAAGGSKQLEPPWTTTCSCTHRCTKQGQR